MEFQKMCSALFFADICKNSITILTLTICIFQFQPKKCFECFFSAKRTVMEGAEVNNICVYSDLYV